MQFKFTDAVDLRGRNRIQLVKLFNCSILSFYECNFLMEIKLKLVTATPAGFGH